MHWITENPIPNIGDKLDITFKNRHSPIFLKAVIEHDAEDSYKVISEERVQGIAPGQFGIIYSADSKLCFGSGVIATEIPKKGK
jgi:tRNA-specific 2-thiouridylase